MVNIRRCDFENYYTPVNCGWVSVEAMYMQIQQAGWGEISIREDEKPVSSSPQRKGDKL